MIDASPKTVVAALNGPALGGGAEVSLACAEFPRMEVVCLGIGAAVTSWGKGLYLCCI